MKQRKRIAAFVLAAAMVFSTLPMNALAVEVQEAAGGLCEHHTEHTADCGYTEGTEGTPCIHEHNEDCYTFVSECIHEHTEDCYPAESVSDNTATPSDAEDREPTACTHECSEESGCITKVLDCQHEHDSECGYTEETAGIPCNFVCEICNPQNGGAQEQCSCITLCTEGNTNLDCLVCGAENADLSQCKGKETDEAVQEQITALPTVEEVAAMTAEQQQAVYEKLQAAHTAYNALTDEQKAQITGAEKLDNLLAFFAGKTNALETQNNVKYLDEDGNDQTTNTVTVIESSTTEWSDGWYLVDSTLSIDSRITVSGEVHLILADGANLTVNGGIGVAENNRFTVYAQSAEGNMGKLTANANDIGKAGIGGGSRQNAGDITIHGGTVNANGGDNAAGIGSGDNGSGGTVTINGGIVNANGEKGGAGIGGGFSASGGTITIHGGTVIANGKNGAAGIGGGFSASGGTVTISGGTVTANGGTRAAGIGGGNEGSGGTITISGGTVNATSEGGGAGIGGGNEGSGGTITINGGTVTATGGGYGAGIGGGWKGSGGDITITGGSVTAIGGDFGDGIGDGVSGSGGSFATGTDGHALIVASSISDKSQQNSWSGIIFDGSDGKVYKDQTLQENLEIPSDKTLTVPENTTLTVNGGVTLICNTTLTNDGTIAGNGTLDGTGNLVGSGSVAQMITNNLRKASAVSVTVSPSLATYASKVTITAKIAKAANTYTAAENQVEFFVETDGNKKSLGTATVTGDTATLSDVEISQEKFAVGSNTITAEYGGSMGLKPQTGSVELAVQGDLKDATVKVNGEYFYTGSPITPEVTVTWNGTPLIKDTDYILSYADNTNAGTATVTVTGTGNYTGTASTTFIIAQSGTAFTDGVTVDKPDNTYIYGDTITVTVTPKATGAVPVSNLLTLTAPAEGQMAIYEGDRQLTGAKNVTSGSELTFAIDTAKAGLGIGNHTLTASFVASDDMAAQTGTVDVTIHPASISTTDVVVVGEPFIYTGSPITPEVTVTWNGTQLTKDTDYTLAYADNTDVGTATVTVTGTGNYIDTKKASFTIGKATPKPTTPTGLTAVYGSTLKDVSLPSGWAWDAPKTSVGNVGENTFPATYTEDNSGNYNEVKQSLTVKVTPASYKLTLTGQADSPTQTTLNEAVVEPGNTGTTVTYGYNTTNSAPDNWQEGRVFSGLTSDTTYYFFAKAAATANHAKTISQGVAIATPKKSVSGIEIINQPANLSYTSGQTLDLNGLSVKVSYNDNTSENITWDSGKLTAEPAQETVLTVAEHDSKVITISYGGKTAETSALTVGKAEQAALSITGAPGKIYKGSSFALQTSGGSGEGAVTWSVVSGPATVDANGTVTVTGTGEFQIKAVKDADVEYNQTEAVVTLTAERKPSGGGGGSSSGGSSSNDGNDSTIIDRPDKNDPNTPTTGQTTPVKPGTNGNANINGSTVQQAIDKATADAKKNGTTANGIAVVVPVNVGDTLKDVQIILKADTLDKLVSSNVKQFTINTDHMTDFGFTLDTLKELNRQTSGDVVFKVKKTTVSSVEAKAAIGTRPAYDISLWEVKNGKETRLTSLNGKTISIAIPYTPAKNEQPGNLYAVSVDATGKVQWITKSSYDADQKAVIFDLTQSGIYGVGYDAKTPAFTDITNHWAKDNILFVVSRGLLNGTSATTFSPNTGMTRGMFVTALGRLAGINPDSYQTGKFTDVKADAYYAPYVNWAAKAGIVSGTTATTFAPDTNINREQMAMIMKNYVDKLGYTVPKDLEAVSFADNANISSWAKEAVQSMQQAGILAGKTNNQFGPDGIATRGEVSTVLRRFVEIIID